MDRDYFSLCGGCCTYYVALALPWTLTFMRGIQVPRYSNAAWVVRFPLTPPVPGPPCAAPWAPELEPPGQGVRVLWGKSKENESEVKLRSEKKIKT